MALISTPTIYIPRFTWGLARADRAIPMFAGNEVVMNPGIALWSCTMPLKIQDIATHRTWSAIFVQLAKLENWIEVVPPEYSAGPSTGYAGSLPVVNGAGQLGLTLNCHGLPNVTSIVGIGDYAQIGTELKLITAAAVSSGSGEVTLEFEPALRNSPTNGTTVDIITPKCRMRFAEASALWSGKQPVLFEKSLQLVEKIS